MPGTVVIPPSPALGLFGSSITTMQNGFGRYQNSMTPSEIKERAREAVQKEARGASALTLIKTARNQTKAAQECELQGDIRGALSAITKAASLANMFMESAELKAEGQKGVLFRELSNFMDHDYGGLKQRADAWEAKLIDYEKITHHTESDEHPARSTGGSIADRMRSLQDAGMAVSTTKRLSREIPKLPTPPTSPQALRLNRFSSQQGLSSPPALQSILPATPISSTASPHTVVPLSSLGPPSPSSSTSSSSSPPLAHLNISEFAHAFPSIDELDEMNGLKQPSPLPDININSGHPPFSPVALDLSPKGAFRSFPVLPVDPGPRPSSTPITPTVDAFMSRPSSPTKALVPLPQKTKPSGLGLSMQPITPTTPTTPSGNRLELPATSTVLPKLLYDYMHQSSIKVLLIDVRDRAAFEKEHIKGDAVVCLEPSVLMRENLNGQMLEDSLVLATRFESSLFHNRDKFDLVAIYDHSSESFGTPKSPLSNLVRTVYETALRKTLKHTPLLLVGGLEAWKRDLGEREVVRGETELAPPDRLKFTASSKPPPAPLGISAVSPPSSAPLSDPHQVWIPRSRTDVNAFSPEKLQIEDPPRYNMDHATGSSRPGTEVNHANGPQIAEFSKPVARRLPLPRPATSSYASDNMGMSTGPMVNGSSGISYPQFPQRITHVHSASPFTPSSMHNITSPKPVSINPSLSRRRSDYIDQSQEAVSGLKARTSIDYPDLPSQHILRPPPAVAPSALERHDNRPRQIQPLESSQSTSQAGPKPPRIASDYPVTYWSDIQIGTSGLKNLGNTCYMNATIQCLSATVPFTRFFIDGRWRNAVNLVNPDGTKGTLAHAFAKILHEMWHGDLPSIAPYEFRKCVGMQCEEFRNSDQHDSQEFLTFLLDGLHEDLNRILTKPALTSSPEREAELERLPQQISSEQEWRNWQTRDDSLVIDYFQGQFRNRLECLTCHKTSTTYNAFRCLQVPVPTGKSFSKVTLQQCLDAFVKTEIMEGADAWGCPHCKKLRKASKQLSISRLPPILVIQLKRFETNGRFTDKIDTFVDYPLKSLDLTNYMPPPLPPGADQGQLNGGRPLSHDDPRSQIPPYRYDLYGVTNHFGGGTGSGHYTAFIASRGGWVYCDDSSVRPTDAKQVVGKPAYVLFYKRVKS